MSGFVFTITSAGLDALVNAQNGNTDEIEIVELGLSEAVVDVAPTLVALPGEFKRIDALSGQSPAENIIHMTALDATDESYDVRSLALFLADGTLFAAYSRAEAPIFTKVDIATFLFSIDIAFTDDAADSIVFGDAQFLFPPATEGTKGIAEIATQGEVDGEADDQRIVTPLKLGVRLGALETQLGDLIAALTARTVTGGGLATGGGDLSANRVLTVLAASAAEVIAGTAADRAITPAALGPIVKSLGLNGYISIPTADPARLVLIQWGRFTAAGDTLTTITFPLAFSAPAFTVVVDGTSETDTSVSSNPPRVRASTINATSFGVFSAVNTSESCTFIAVGEIDNS